MGVDGREMFVDELVPFPDVVFVENFVRFIEIFGEVDEFIELLLSQAVMSRR